ncbi:unnamed protein product [Moneuplotes crassus]|uniref:Uncharacterized protein n=1 Tax=Euplotes crassus TaxID=5936 RepID=A0AAD1UJ85_EUPCR|nr:unnamed protein product [Moneuplotes crassus]
MQKHQRSFSYGNRELSYKNINQELNNSVEGIRVTKKKKILATNLYQTYSSIEIISPYQNNPKQDSKNNLNYSFFPSSKSIKQKGKTKCRLSKIPRKTKVCKRQVDLPSKSILGSSPESHMVSVHPKLCSQGNLSLKAKLRIKNYALKKLKVCLVM